jgi:hypothetical protein
VSDSPTLHSRWLLFLAHLAIGHVSFQAVSEEKIFLNSSQSETRIALGGHICWWNGTKWRNFIDDIT